MKKLAYLIIFVAFLTGCQKQLTVEEQFDEIVKEAKDGTNESIIYTPSSKTDISKTSIYNGGDDYFTRSLLGIEYIYNGEFYKYEDDGWEKGLEIRAKTTEDLAEKTSSEAEINIASYQGIFNSLSTSTDAKYEKGVYYYNVQDYEYVLFTYEELYLEIGKDYLFLKSKRENEDDSIEMFLSVNPKEIPEPEKMEKFETQKPSDKYNFLLKK